MTKISRLDNKYYFNFDDKSLYFNGEAIKELDPRLSSVLEYFAQHPNCYLKAKEIGIGLGYVADSTVRGYILRLRRAHSIFEKKLINGKKGSGYKYTGHIIETIKTNDPIDKSMVIATIEMDDFLSKAKEIEIRLINSIMRCNCKWGSCTYSSSRQNTNTCEGAIVLVSSKQHDKYTDEIEEALAFLQSEITNIGLKSKSLDEETVVPSSMYLYLLSLNNLHSKESSELAERIWNARTQKGWGIYVKRMEKYANIGCTYWALTGLANQLQVSSCDFQKYLRSLFKYAGAFSYGNTIDEVNPRVPCLYATAMMYIIFNLLKPDNQKVVGNKYDAKKALDFIINSFDNRFYLTEQEGLNGVEIEGKTTVHTVNWMHITIDYCMTALSIAMTKGNLTCDAVKTILSRLLKLIEENTEKSDGLLYWAPPSLSLEKEGIGKLIFPTMHFVMGLQKVINSIELLRKSN